MSFQKIPEKQEQQKNRHEKRKKSNQKPPDVEAQINDNSSKKRKRKEFAPFGNYRNYYGYRIGHDLDEDPRLKVLRKEWFEGKDCLDIGCNSGVITIQIAKMFGCRRILGIDIDSDRIEDAKWNLRETLRKLKKTNSDASKLKVASTAGGTSRDYRSSKEKNLSDIVSFREGNFVQNWHSPPGKHYDTILCLSVTKWIHLNWGDEGVITLFTKIWRLLHPGGILVLEPQPWRSYQSNRGISETTAANYHTIKLPPDQFQDMLLDKIGFRTVEDLTSGLSGSTTGFNRPILAFRK